ncbi:unnamed protein product [Cylindrotheca closterium]|uniref:Uncharacterized protein n=1 Tax=Cylindrotheca closterium TaxID=2856 RepID=A0AAD2CNN1_9STRA|nr:unnamed protein product [Cylindrotheca closterium]
MSDRKDVIQISLGPTANAIAAHSFNLQGLAATSSDNLCDPHVTHYAEQHKWVPRALFIDEPTRFAIPPSMMTAESLAASFQQQQQQQQGGGIHHSWTGQVETIDQGLLQHNPFQFPEVMNAASILANSAHSRYYAPSTETVSSSSYKTSASNSRHVNWDDNENEEEEEEEEEEDEYERSSRLMRQQNQWKQNTEAPLQSQLDKWGESAILPATTTTTTTTTTNETATVSSAQTSAQTFSPNIRNSNWMDILMPPYSQSSKVPLPYSQQSHMHPHWDSYHSTTDTIQSWKENDLVERIRHMLEASDTVQGVCFTTEGCGLYAGLTTHLLQEFQDECKSAARLVVHVVNPQDGGDTNATTSDGKDGNEQQQQVATAQEESWQPFHVNRLRHNLSHGLAMSDFDEHAHATLPLRLDGGSSNNSNKKSLFEQTAQLAMALESATLPFRMNPSSSSASAASAESERYTIGLQNAPFFGQGGGDSRWGTTAKSLSMWEYLACLQPQRNCSILEMDVLGTTTTSTMNKNGGGGGGSKSSSRGSKSFNSSELWERFQVGTSVERDHRMRTSGRDAQRNRPQDVAPGSWLKDVKDGGVLTSVSLENPTKRSLHTHFSLNTMVRPILPTTSDASNNHQYPYSSPLSQYLTCIVEGMGISYRPERSMSLILDQTVHRLTRGGYGAGSYWKSLVHPETPVVAVLGNTTRVYPYLNQVSTDMKTVLGHRYRGLYNRDLMNGVLPESEDSSMALEQCYNLADTYRPPSGSGLVDDDADIDW